MTTTGVRSIVVYVRDPEESRRFYERALGLRAIGAAAGRVEFDIDGIRLLLHPTTVDDVDRGVARHGRTEIYFRCEDVDAAAAELRSAGVEIIQEATDQPWGERDVAVIDPDGLPVFLTQQLEP